MKESHWFPFVLIGNSVIRNVQIRVRNIKESHWLPFVLVGASVARVNGGDEASAYIIRYAGSFVRIFRDLGQI